MVKYHASVHGYCHDGGDPVSYTATVDKDLEGAKQLIKAGYDALHDGDARTFRPIFERYFGILTESKRERVRSVFEKMMKFVENDEEVDVVIHIGTDHLSDDTSVYIKTYSQRVKCILDLSVPNAFDKDESRMTCIVNADDQRLDFKSGRCIFVNPDSLRHSHVLAPFSSDESSQIHEGCLIENYASLPATLFHELTHTVLLGGKKERLVDVEIVPAKLAKSLDLKHIPDNYCSCALNFDHEQKVYADFMCHLVARSPPNRNLTLYNADSYKYFALAAYLSQGEWEFSRGRAKPKRRQKVHDVDAEEHESTNGKEGESGTEQGNQNNGQSAEKPSQHEHRTSKANPEKAAAGIPSDSESDDESPDDEVESDGEVEDEDDRATSVRACLRSFITAAVTRLRRQKPTSPDDRPIEGTSAQDLHRAVSHCSLTEDPYAVPVMPGAYPDLNESSRPCGQRELAVEEDCNQTQRQHHSRTLRAGTGPQATRGVGGGAHEDHQRPTEKRDHLSTLKNLPFADVGWADAEEYATNSIQRVKPVKPTIAEQEEAGYNADDSTLKESKRKRKRGGRGGKKNRKGKKKEDKDTNTEEGGNQDEEESQGEESGRAEAEWQGVNEDGM